MRARRRLIGATVLVLLGVIGFPLLLDTRPRPVAIDTPIAIRSKDDNAVQRPAKPRAAAPAPARETGAASAAGVVVAEAPVEPRPEPQATAPVAPAPQAVTPKPSAAPKPAAEPAAKPADSRGSREVAAKDATRARSLLEGKEAPPAAANGRYVVQVGAFSEPAAARDARQRVERLGLKTYTQVVETSAGKRIRVRVGPYGERGEAERAVAKLKQAGLAPALLTL